MLTVERVNFAYGQIPILRDECLTVNSGEFLHLYGENGAGKSTLLSVIAGILKCQSGDIFWQSGSEEYPDIRSFIEYMPAEGNAHFQQLTAVENLKFWLGLKAKNLDFDQLFPVFQRWGFRTPYLIEQLPVEKYSTGMKRRLALCRLQVSPAKIWLLDEPFYGLDAKACDAFMELLMDHVKGGGCGIIISHDLQYLDKLPMRRHEIRKVN